MVFSKYMNNLPNTKVDTIQKIAEVTSSSTMTVYRWINGTVEPPMVKKKIIAEFLGFKLEDLFPQKNK